jgi:hypothetical protein
MSSQGNGTVQPPVTSVQEPAAGIIEKALGERMCPPLRPLPPSRPLSLSLSVRPSIQTLLISSLLLSPLPTRKKIVWMTNERMRSLCPPFCPPLLPLSVPLPYCATYTIVNIRWQDRRELKFLRNKKQILWQAIRNQLQVSVLKMKKSCVGTNAPSPPPQLLLPILTGSVKAETLYMGLFIVRNS